MNDSSTMMKTGDIDIDFADRAKALSLIEHVPASIIRHKKIEKHNTGAYFQTVPRDPFTGLASLHYETANTLGWYKVDLLNVWVYERIMSEQHLLDLMHGDINWQLFEYPEFVQDLIHIGNHHRLVCELKPRSIMDMAIILALIRPGKKHLTDDCIRGGFDYIKDRIWTPPVDGAYYFKKSHAVGYSYLVKVHALLQVEDLQS
jgi:hypothetical protein